MLDVQGFETFSKFDAKYMGFLTAAKQCFLHFLQVKNVLK